MLVFLIPTEIYPTTARASGTAVSVIIWGLANFTITLITPILFNNLNYWLFLVFAASNAFAGWFTWIYQPETGMSIKLQPLAASELGIVSAPKGASFLTCTLGARSFEENQRFFTEAKEKGDWRVSKISGGEFNYFPGADKRADGGQDGNGEEEPLLARIRAQA